MWPPSMNSMPSGTPHSLSHVRGPADHGDDVLLQAGGREGPPEVRQRVGPPGGRIDQGRVVVLPARLVFLRAVMVVHRHDQLAGLRAAAAR